MRATVLCYNLKGTTKGRKIGLIFGFLGYRVRHVEKEEYMLPVGEVAEGRTTESINEEAGVKTKEIEAVFQDEMLLMCPEAYAGSGIAAYEKRKSSGSVKSRFDRDE